MLRQREIQLSGGWGLLIEAIVNNPFNSFIVVSAKMGGSLAGSNQPLTTYFFGKRQDTYTAAISLLGIGFGFDHLLDIVSEVRVYTPSPGKEFLGAPFTDKAVV